MGGYIIGPYVQEYYRGQNDKFHRQAADIDEKLQLIMNLRRGTLLKIFPLHDGKSVIWHSPVSNLPETTPNNQQLYIQNVFSLLYTHALASEYTQMNDIITKMARFQQKNGGASLPSPVRIKAETIYNRVPFATILLSSTSALDSRQ